MFYNFIFSLFLLGGFYILINIFKNPEKLNDVFPFSKIKLGLVSIVLVIGSIYCLYITNTSGNKEAEAFYKENNLEDVTKSVDADFVKERSQYSKKDYEGTWEIYDSSTNRPATKITIKKNTIEDLISGIKVNYIYDNKLQNILLDKKETLKFLSRREAPSYYSTAYVTMQVKDDTLTMFLLVKPKVDELGTTFTLVGYKQ